MCISLLSALRRLISGVDITPSISRQELFFHFITSLTIYVHLITISHLRQFPSVVYISLYLFIFRFFFSILLHPSIIQSTHIRCVVFSSTCSFVHFWVVVPPMVLQRFYDIRLMEGQLCPPVGLPWLLCSERKNTGFPWIWGRLWQYSPSHTGTI